jgi:hypothetical protein
MHDTTRYCGGLPDIDASGTGAIAPFICASGHGLSEQF